MANVSESAVDPKMLASIQGCVQDGIKFLKLEDKVSDPKSLVAAVDAFIFEWQKGNRPEPEVIDPEDVPYMMGSLWGQQLVDRFNWQWGTITFHDHGNSKAVGVLSPDRALAVYPFHFIVGCCQNPGVDCTIALFFNMMEAGFPAQNAVKPGDYLNPMDGVHRIVPRSALG